MYKRIAVLYDGSPESWRALRVAIPLAKTLHAELEVLVMKPRRPAYY